MDRTTVNGGFPTPPATGAVRLVRARHERCGRETRVRLPAPLPAQIVRRVVCEGCAEAYHPSAVVEQDIERRARRLRDMARHPAPGAWRYVSVPVAGLVVLGTLTAIQGGSGTDADPAASSRTASSKAKAARHGSRNGANAQLVSESTFALALPKGWSKVAPAGGATFAAVAPGSAADATLWVERDPKLDFATFEARSLEQLRQLTGNAHLVERITGPTPNATSIRIAADAPAGAPAYEVVLRSGGGVYWYYLATSLQPDAPSRVAKQVELIQGSLVPQGGAR